MIKRTITSQHVVWWLVSIACVLSACTSSPHPPNDKYDGICKLNMASSPEIRGLRLGMTVEQVKERFPSLNIPPADEAGNIDIEINKYAETNNASAGLDLEGVARINFSFFDGHLRTIWVHYEKKPEALTQEEFSSKLSQTLKLPSFYSHLECYDFSLTAYISESWSEQGPTLHVEDVAAFKTYIDRLGPIRERERREAERAKAEKEGSESEERKKTFTP